MNKDEILAKSREENKDKDLFEKEVQRNAGNAGAIAASIIATIFFAVQILVGKGMNYGLYATVFSIPTAGYIFKSIRLKRDRDILIAVGYTICTLGFSFAHMYQLITSSTIL